jgi:guanylate kinase
VAYHFLSREEFTRREAAGEFVETATFGGERYGTLRSEIRRVLESGRHAVLDIEVEGARQVRRAFPDSVQVFILPPSVGVLLDRLGTRNTESGERLARRLAHASQELAQAGAYDYLVINDDLVAAVDRVAAIIDAEAARVARIGNLPEVLDDMRAEVEARRQRQESGRQGLL